MKHTNHRTILLHMKHNNWSIRVEEHEQAWHYFNDVSNINLWLDDEFMLETSLKLFQTQWDSTTLKLKYLRYLYAIYYIFYCCIWRLKNINLFKHFDLFHWTLKSVLYLINTVSQKALINKSSKELYIFQSSWLCCERVIYLLLNLWYKQRIFPLRINLMPCSWLRGWVSCSWSINILTWNLFVEISGFKFEHPANRNSESSLI